MGTVANEAEPPVAGPSRDGAGAEPAGPGEPRATIAGRYEVDLAAPIGGGGMALVYRGRDLRTRRPVAVKTLRLEYKQDPDTRARFRREARLLAFLAHPNVVRVFDFVEDRGATWVVLEQLSGRSLKDVVAERGPLPAEEVAAILEQAASALGHLHGRGLVHLDVKPQNLQLAEDGRIKLIDFGLAQAAGGPQQSVGGRTFGTAAYLAPEQACGEAVEPATDVYALGCVVYELLTGRPPFGEGRGGDRKNDVVRARLERLPTPPTRARPDLKLPAWVDDVVLWALAREPSARYASAETFARVFRAAVEGERVVDIGTTGRVPAVEVPASWPEAAPNGRPNVGANGLMAWGNPAVARRSARLRRGLWRAVVAVGVVDVLLAVGLLLGTGELPGVYDPGPPVLGAGSDARVVVPDARVRDAPGLASTALWALDEGEWVEITGQAVPGDDGRRWWPVVVDRNGGSATGYMAEEVIAPERRTPLERLADAIGFG